MNTDTRLLNFILLLSVINYNISSCIAFCSHTVRWAGDGRSIPSDNFARTKSSIRRPLSKSILQYLCQNHAKKRLQTAGLLLAP